MFLVQGGSPVIEIFTGSVLGWPGGEDDYPGQCHDSNIWIYKINNRHKNRGIGCCY